MAKTLKKPSAQHVVRGPKTNGSFVVRDGKTGQFVEVRGADSMKSAGLTLKKGIDLTKPIATQALRGSARQQKSAAKG